MEWTVSQGKIMADGKPQDFATYLWTIRGAGQTVTAERKLLLQQKRLPAIQRLGFGKAQEAALIAARHAIGQPEILTLVEEGQACPIPTVYRAELAEELRKADMTKLAVFLGL